MVEITEIGPEQRELFDSYVENAPGGDFRQTFGWGAVRAADGWAPRRFLARRDGEVVGAASVLAGRLPHLPFNLLHVPCGPVMDYGAPEVVGAFTDLLRRLAREVRADLVRIDPPVSAGDAQATRNLAAAGFLPSPLPWTFWNAPREVVRMDITPPEGVLFRGLSKGKRQRISSFRRRGLTAETSQHLPDMLAFQAVMQGLGARNGFMVRDEAYWRALWTEFVARDQGALLLIRSGGQVIGGLFVVLCGRICYSLHSADVRITDGRQERPSDALYWASILYARDRACTVFDMMGYVSESHLRYKLGFGAEVARLASYHELAGRPFRGRLFWTLERHVLPWAVPFVARLRALAQRKRLRGSATGSLSAQSPASDAETLKPTADAASRR